MAKFLQGLALVREELRRKATISLLREDLDSDMAEVALEIGGLVDKRSAALPRLAGKRVSPV